MLSYSNLDLTLNSLNWWPLVEVELLRVKKVDGFYYSVLSDPSGIVTVQYFMFNLAG